MTGRDLILYILENNLENEPVIKNGTFIGFVPIQRAAAKFKVGVETVKLWIKLGRIKGVEVGSEIYILASELPNGE